MRTGLAVVAVVASVAAVAAPAAAAGAVDVHLVDARDEGKAYNFRPSKLTIPPGTTVRWMNDEDVFHTVTSSNSTDVRKPNGMFDARLAGKGETFEFTFDSEGEFPYYCKPHSPFMYAVIRVQEGVPAEGVRESLDGDAGDGGDDTTASDADEATPAPGAMLVALAGVAAAFARARRT